MQQQERKIAPIKSQEADSTDCLMQDSYLTTALGGPIPKKICMSGVHSILDIGCGNSTWAQEVVQLYPNVEVIGIDTDAKVLKSAQRRADLSGAGKRVSFRQMALNTTLDFNDCRFDLVHMRKNGIHVLSPIRVYEMIRILRPGGWLNLVQYVPGLTSSETFNTIERKGLHLLHMKYTDSPDTDDANAATRMYAIMLDAYLLDVSYTVHAVDIGYGNGAGAREYVHGLLAAAEAFKGLFVRFGFYDAESYDQLLAQARAELTAPHACGYTYLISSLGRKDE